LPSRKNSRSRRQKRSLLSRSPLKRRRRNRKRLLSMLYLNLILRTMVEIGKMD
jgi:hypothetical protein